MKRGTFREDLYYRLNVFHIHIPPLRERYEDIQELARYILQRLNNRMGLWKELSNEAIDYLKSQNWPGNVRQLENVLERAMAVSENEVLGKEDFASLIEPRQATSEGEP